MTSWTGKDKGFLGMRRAALADRSHARVSDQRMFPINPLSNSPLHLLPRLKVGAGRSCGGLRKAPCAHRVRRNAGIGQRAPLSSPSHAPTPRELID
jgi:hypothetical protein